VDIEGRLEELEEKLKELLKEDKKNYRMIEFTLSNINLHRRLLGREEVETERNINPEED